MGWPEQNSLELATAGASDVVEGREVGLFSVLKWGRRSGGAGQDICNRCIGLEVRDLWRAV